MCVKQFGWDQKVLNYTLRAAPLVIGTVIAAVLSHEL